MLHLAGYAVRSAMRTAEPSFPRLFCVEASLVLQRLLVQLGHQARVVTGDFRLDKSLPNSVDEPEEGLTMTYAHNWVEVGDTVVDITGDQFEHGLDRPWPTVYIGPRTDRYINAMVDDRSGWLESPQCQAALFELRHQFPGFVPADGPEGGLGAGDFSWWSGRDKGDEERFTARLGALGKRVESLLTDLTFRGTGRILPEENAAWTTWAPPTFGDNEAYRHRPHITLDVTPVQLVLHINLELAKNADHFVKLVRKDADWVLRQVRQFGWDLELQIYQRREKRPRLWPLERPAFYPLCDLTPDSLRGAVDLARAWGKREGTRQGFFLSQRIPAARAIALGACLPAELARRIAQLRPGLDDFDWHR